MEEVYRIADQAKERKQHNLYEKLFRLAKWAIFEYHENGKLKRILLSHVDHSDLMIHQQSDKGWLIDLKFTDISEDLEAKKLIAEHLFDGNAFTGVLGQGPDDVEILTDKYIGRILDAL